MNRRAYLASVVGLSTATLAGCTTASGSVSPPQVDETRLKDDGWELTEDETERVFEREFGGVVTVTADAYTVTYEHRALQDDLAEKTLGNVDFAPASFFASRVQFDPNIADLPAGVGLKELMEETTENAKESFEQQLRGMGLSDVEEREETSLEIDAGETADAYRYTATYPFDAMSLQLTDDSHIEIEGGELPIDGWLAVWHHDGSVLISGGGYPAENFARTVEESLTSGIDVTVEIDLELEPDRYEEKLLALIAAVR